MLLLPTLSLLLASLTLSTAQVSDHLFGILKQSEAGQFVVAPYCSAGSLLTLVRGISTPAQTFRLANGNLLVNVGNDTPAAVQVSSDGALAFTTPDQASAGFAPDASDVYVTYNGQSEFCALNGQIFVGQPNPACEIFQLRGIYYYRPGNCGE